jgi:hypothetical protein
LHRLQHHRRDWRRPESRPKSRDLVVMVRDIRSALSMKLVTEIEISVDKVEKCAYLKIGSEE